MNSPFPEVLLIEFLPLSAVAQCWLGCCTTCRYRVLKSQGLPAAVQPHFSQFWVRFILVFPEFSCSQFFSIFLNFSQFCLILLNFAQLGENGPFSQFLRPVLGM